MIYADPTDAAVTLTLPDPSTVKGLRYKIANRHYGNGLMGNGDCESATAPYITGETGNDVYGGVFSRSSTEAHGGTYSWKWLRNTAVGTSGVRFHDASADLHQLTAGQTYTMAFWVYIESPLQASEVYIGYYDHDLGAFQSQVYATQTDAWERMSITFTIPTAATDFELQLEVLATAGNGEYLYVDDLRLYEHLDVTLSGPIENVASITLSSEGDHATVEADGDKYLLTEYSDHGQNTNGEWERRADGTQECWDAFSITSAAVGGSLNYPMPFVDVKACPVWEPNCLNSEAEGSCVLNLAAASFEWGLKAALGAARAAHYRAVGRWR